MYPAAQSLDELREIYEEYQSRKGGKREVIDRILEGDWRHGITLYQLAMADMRNLLDHPTAQRWTALKFAHIKATPPHDNPNSKKCNMNVCEATALPRFNASTFLRNLQQEIAPVVKAHYYLTRADGLPLTLLRIQIYDSPYSSQRALQERSSNASQNPAETSKTIWVAFPDGTPAIYVSLATVIGPGAAGEGRNLRKVVLDVCGRLIFQDKVIDLQSRRYPKPSLSHTSGIHFRQHLYQHVHYRCFCPYVGQAVVTPPLVDGVSLLMGLLKEVH